MHQSSKAIKLAKRLVRLADEVARKRKHTPFIESENFYYIYSPKGQNALRWAETHWRDYGFDYSRAHSDHEKIYAWPYYGTYKDLERHLKEDNIKFEEAH